MTKRTEHYSSSIPGLFGQHPLNSRVKALQEPPWPELLFLLGISGRKIMMNLLLDCSIFVNLFAGFQNYYQLTGTHQHLNQYAAGSDTF